MSSLTLTAAGLSPPADSFLLQRRRSLALQSGEDKMVLHSGLIM